MKYVIGLIIFVWLLCGVIGAWMLDDLNRHHWKTIIRGPITLVTAVKEHPASVHGISN
jgi:hypothetical protein